MIDASNAVMDHIQSLVLNRLYQEIEFFPGKHGAGIEDKEGFVLFTLIQNVDYMQPYIHVDVIEVEIYHERQLTLQQIGSLVSSDLNRENVRENNGLWASARDRHVLLQDVNVVFTGNTHGSFIGGKDYYCLKGDIVIQYVETLFPAYLSRHLFVEGA
jgi:hypothetical protein